MYKILLKELLKDINIWRDSLCLWIEKLNIVKIVILSKLIYVYIYQFNPYQIPSRLFFAEINKLILKFV